MHPCILIESLPVFPSLETVPIHQVVCWLPIVHGLNKLLGNTKHPFQAAHEVTSSQSAMLFMAPDSILTARNVYRAVLKFGAHPPDGATAGNAAICFCVII